MKKSLSIPRSAFVSNAVSIAQLLEMGMWKKQHDFRRLKYLQDNQQEWGRTRKRERLGRRGRRQMIIHIFYADYTVWGGTEGSAVRLKDHAVSQPKHFNMFFLVEHLRRRTVPFWCLFILINDEVVVEECFVENHLFPGNKR